MGLHEMTYEQQKFHTVAVLCKSNGWNIWSINTLTNHFYEEDPFYNPEAVGIVTTWREFTDLKQIAKLGYKAKSWDDAHKKLTLAWELKAFIVRKPDELTAWLLESSAIFHG